VAALIKLGLGGAESGIVVRVRFLVIEVSAMLSGTSIRNSRIRAGWLGKTVATNQSWANTLSSRELTAMIQTTRKMLAQSKPSRLKRVSPNF